MRTLTRVLSTTAVAVVGAVAVVAIPSWTAGGNAADAATRNVNVGSSVAMIRSVRTPNPPKRLAPVKKLPPVKTAAGAGTTAGQPVTPTAITSLAPQQLKIMNWYPANASWSNTWSRYDHDTVDSDFKIIKGLNANTVRIIVQPAVMGFPNVLPARAAAFRDVLTTAAANGLAVQLTLFDLFGNYDQVQKSVAWVKNLAALVPDMRLVRLVELQNEINPRQSAAVSWARTMLPVLSQNFPGVPRTLSVNGTSRLAGIQDLDKALGDELDVVDVHLYDDWGNAYTTLTGAKALANGRPVIIGEAGQATIPKSAASEQSQAAFFAKLQLLTSSLGLPSAGPWTLNDFTSAGASIALNDNSANIGLRRTDGTMKPAAKVVRSIFGGQQTAMQQAMTNGTGATATTDALLDGGMEDELMASDQSLYGNWRSLNTQLADRMGITDSQPNSGSRAAYIKGAGGSAAGLASFCQPLPIPSSRSVKAQALTKLVDAGRKSTSVVSVGWFTAGSQYLGQNQSASAVPNGAWQQVQVAGNAPSNAAFMQICVKSFDNPGTTFFDNVALTAN